MACTVAVEEAIDAHYSAQLETMDEAESHLRRTVEKFRSEELEHRSIALEHGAEQAFGYRLLSQVIKVGCRVAIAVSEHV
jgi:3-demethoxyubiquinol 3-hydroxylase